VISCEEMFPAAHEFIMHYTHPPGAAKTPALVDILKPMCAIYPVDLPAACQGTSSNTEDGQEALTMVRSPCYNLTRGHGFLLGAVVSPCHMHYENYKCRRPGVLVREGFQNSTVIIREHSQGHTADMFSENETRGLWRTAHGGFVLILYRDEIVTCCTHVKKVKISQHKQ